MDRWALFLLGPEERSIIGLPCAAPGRIGIAVSSVRDLGTLAFLADALDRLANAVDGSDQAPSPDAISGFEQARTGLDRALAEWQALKATAVK